MPLDKQAQVKECPPGKVLNPKTNRCVKIDGRIGKSLGTPANDKKDVIKDDSKGKKKATPKKAIVIKSKKDKKEELIQSVKNQCHNDTEPITMDRFEDMSTEDLERLVYIGKDKMKNCYLVDSIHEVYKNAVLSQKEFRDPVNPSHVVTSDEIATINKLMKKNDPKYKPPVYKKVEKVPKDYDLVIIPSPHSYLFFQINITYQNRIKYDLGVVPAFVEADHTGSVDYTSAVLVTNIRELWEQGKLLNTNGTCKEETNRILKKPFQYWIDDDDWRKFMIMCNGIVNL
jgi:hypothetical protein